MKTIKNILRLKYYFILMLILFPVTSLFAQNKNEVSGVEVVKTNTQEVAGVNIGFFVEFKNNNKDQAVDAIKYTVSYYDGFEEKQGEKSFKWQSGNIIKSIEPGKTSKDYRANWIKGANKIKIIITRVHLVAAK
jgi:hypothetical protein